MYEKNLDLNEDYIEEKEFDELLSFFENEDILISFINDLVENMETYNDDTVEVFDIFKGTSLTETERTMISKLLFKNKKKINKNKFKQNLFNILNNQ